MDPNLIIGIEMFLTFAIVVGFCVWQLVSLRRYKEQDALEARRKAEAAASAPASAPTSAPTAGHAEGQQRPDPG